jgi:LAO/AO transport system kinase
MNPGWGDAMQANKAGLLEVADIFIINKADRAGVRETRRDLEQMLDMGAERQWRPPILETVATFSTGVDAAWVAINEHREFQASTGRFEARRREQVRSELARVLTIAVRSKVDIVTEGERYEAQVTQLLDGSTDPYRAAEALLEWA